MTVYRLAAVLGLATMVLSAPEAMADRDVLHTERSLYQSIVVYEQGGLRCMSFYRRAVRGARQTCMKVANPNDLIFDYTKMMTAALYVVPEPARILVIGLGGGTLPKIFEKLLPDARIDAVEVDRAVISVADRFFGMRAHDRLRVHESDGRVFVKRAIGRGSYDLVVLDAFNQDYIPEHLLTQEFLTEVRQLMKPGSVLAANTYTGSALYAHESATYGAVFGQFYNLRAGSNRVIIARLGGLLSREELQRNADRHEPALRPLGVSKDWLLSRMSTDVDWRRDVRPLTDQYSPSNLLNNHR